MSSMFTQNKLIMLSFYENNEYGVPLTGKAADWQNSKGRPSRQEIENELAEIQFKKAKRHSYDLARDDQYWSNKLFMEKLEKELNTSPTGVLEYLSEQYKQLATQEERENQIVKWREESGMSFAQLEIITGQTAYKLKKLWRDE
ncbi:hypothetical protein [Limosilactobacillus fermentum]|uniref:hypothetical protein n=1 Tax=Limosilactobacillus fermentum TaxID=1613 RepID=UPI001362386C|nr:hypothetical protein [Limosilactobacillus fermentum]MCZ2326554.1 hypothetical protein [Limosilactobacillus fermentum]